MNEKDRMTDEERILILALTLFVGTLAWIVLSWCLSHDPVGAIGIHVGGPSSARV